MSEPRFRIGVFEDKIVDWRTWHVDYSTGQEAIHELAKVIKRDLAKFRLYEIQENKNIPEEKRHQLLHVALMDVARSIGVF